jgi:uncharacterized phage-associated protein
MDSQPERDNLINKLLLLFLVNKAQEKSHNYLGILKLQKLIFLAEKNLHENGIKALTYDFFMWNLGPLSKEIYVDYKMLTHSKILNQNANITLSKKGRYILSDFQEIFEDNKDILKIIEDIIDAFAQYDTECIVQYVQNLTLFMEGCGEPRKIMDLEKGMDLITGLSHQDSSLSFVIDDSWLETLDILLDKELCESIDRSEQDIKDGKVIHLRGVL